MSRESFSGLITRLKGALNNVHGPARRDFRLRENRFANKEITAMEKIGDFFFWKNNVHCLCIAAAIARANVNFTPTCAARNLGLPRAKLRVKKFAKFFKMLLGRERHLTSPRPSERTGRPSPVF